MASNLNKYHIPYVDHACCVLGNDWFFMIFWCVKNFPQIKVCMNLWINAKTKNMIVTIRFWRNMPFFIAFIRRKICFIIPWWRHQMETFSMLLALWVGNQPINCGFLSQSPVTRGFDVFCDVRLAKRMNKQSRRQWFDTPSRSLWCHCNALIWNSIDLHNTDSLLGMLKMNPNAKQHLSGCKKCDTVVFRPILLVLVLIGCYIVPMLIKTCVIHRNFM